ncbi:MAG: indole-3-glycerol-phosphate synthase TrpC [Bacteroidetes bacterium]|nr:indole-3-glycerol-phosphate synthase TrpC [Bacteroidota bacterium]
MNRLERILDHKRAEVAMRRCERPTALLREAIAQQAAAQTHGPTAGPAPSHANSGKATRSLRASLLETARAARHPAVIAEFKRRSPSAGALRDAGAQDPASDVGQIALGYANAGAAGLSILTDEAFFGGSAADLMVARETVALPLLRKDFILEPYQLLEAKLWGADVVLLIAECLSASELGDLHQQALALGLEVLVEVHDAASLAKLPGDLAMVGINHRDLRDFSVDIRRGPERLPALRKACPDALFVAESGIKSAADAQLLLYAGFDALLIGSLFMREPDPAAALSEFLRACGGRVDRMALPNASADTSASNEQMFNL